jgi:hypothetical protein
MECRPCRVHIVAMCRAARGGWAQRAVAILFGQRLAVRCAPCPLYLAVDRMQWMQRVPRGALRVNFFILWRPIALGREVLALCPAPFPVRLARFAPLGQLTVAGPHFWRHVLRDRRWSPRRAARALVACAGGQVGLQCITPPSHDEAGAPRSACARRRPAFSHPPCTSVRASARRPGLQVSSE